MGQRWVMKSRELKKSEQVHYFAPVAPADDAGKATREMLPLAPFVVSGGRNTERYFDSSGKRLKKLLKREKYVQDSAWVKRLLDEGRLEQAVERAKACLAREMKEKGKHSYTKVFKAFE